MSYAAARRAQPDPDAERIDRLLPVVIGAAIFISLCIFVIGVTYTVALVAALGGVALVLVKPRVGLHIAVVATLLSEMHLRSPNSPTGAMLFKSMAAQGILLTPIEMLLFLAFAGMAARIVLDDEIELRLGDLMIPLALLMLATFIGIGVGMAQGNVEMSVLRSETRGLFYLPVLYLLGTHFLTKREHIEQLFWVFIIAANIMSAENVYRYFAYVRGSYNLEISPSLAFSHESALFAALAVIFLMARVVWSPSIFSEWKSFALMALPIAALLVMRRRAGMVALDAGLILLCIVLLKENLKLFLIVVPVAILGVGALLMMTWNSPGGSGTFARSFRAATGSEVSERDTSSDDYRKTEMQNIRLNIQGNPVVGLGFGQPFTFYIQVADLSGWPLWQYVPHNSILWFWMKAGIVGFVSLATLLGAAIARSVQILRGARDRLRGHAFSMCASVAMFVLYSWVDLGLVTPRTLMVFGVTLGVIGALGYIARSESLEAAEAAR